MLTEIKWCINQLIKLMILEILKQYVLLVIKLEIMLSDLIKIEDFIKKTKPRDPTLKKLKEDVLGSALSLLKGRELIYKASERGTFQRLEESQEGEGLKILTPNQMLERLPIALAQVKAGNNSESLLNEIRQIVYSLYR